MSTKSIDAVNNTPSLLRCFMRKTSWLQHQALISPDLSEMPGPELYLLPPGIEGVPTEAELRAYPSQFSWERLKGIVQSGELADFKRAPELQKRYAKWYQGITDQYGSTENYLLKKRLPWPETDESPQTTQAAVAPAMSFDANGLPVHKEASVSASVSILIENCGSEYLRWTPGQEADKDIFAVLPNDWPYDTPADVQHLVVWSKLPIYHPALIDNDPEKWAKVNHEGFAGFTGTGGEDWFTEGGQEISKMVADLWKKDDFECLWFVNPPRIQSVRGVAHYHVFARKKADP